MQAQREEVRIDITIHAHQFARAPRARANDLDEHGSCLFRPHTYSEYEGRFAAKEGSRAQSGTDCAGPWGTRSRYAALPAPTGSNSRVLEPLRIRPGEGRGLTRSPGGRIAICRRPYTRTHARTYTQDSIGIGFVRG
ncbi:hypothetical protein BD309DRAFT_884334, partial [Dichomitus squalens]|uniref:Uncharacterized protein n=1 Tax=Dichomitus squalens TaxID=114155 RepID=A0A4Q9PW97_9APHY